MNDKVAVICTIALVRALGLVVHNLSVQPDLVNQPATAKDAEEIVAELQKLGNMLD